MGWPARTHSTVPAVKNCPVQIGTGFDAVHKFCHWKGLARWAAETAHTSSGSPTMQCAAQTGTPFPAFPDRSVTSSSKHRSEHVGSVEPSS